MRRSKARVLTLVLTIIIGILLGFFGVFVSVFADGGTRERTITIAVILFIYWLLGCVLGLIFPEYSWKWGIALGGPGFIILVLYMIKEFNPLYLLYLIGIAVFSIGSTWGCSYYRNRTKEN
ncbi:DUF6954 family protein [Parasporobacterium paucivorans]|uniref:Uncharacterized protein n=1 Tax=Parasporobacterium paucivorans DSM 15970 TaxID=1122934 RepID=A0A1M6DJL7_9FIRM|nr:hypothetical protein [Parasporobacterium paucivorans]SHI73456.1 hypothetical protein SAMN02745691_00733 [Parasporobacterium paucivorans DSM 15970]